MNVEKLGITKGPWKVHHLGKHWNNPQLEDYEIHWSDDGECICDTVYEKTDAYLIAAAPEMLEALIENALWVEEDGNEGWNLYGQIDIIQSATGKTWEEIKELLL